LALGRTELGDLAADGEGDPIRLLAPRSDQAEHVTCPPVREGSAAVARAHRRVGCINPFALIRDQLSSSKNDECLLRGRCLSHGSIVPL
jgi:hypothetical protein